MSPFQALGLDLPAPHETLCLCRHLTLLLGGLLLAVVTMGPYCPLILLPALSFVLMLKLVSPPCLHTWVFLVQMSWQTAWHLFLQYKEYKLREAPDARLLIAMSSLMLLTQRVTSVSMDVQDGQVTLRGLAESGSHLQKARSLLPFLSYTLYFPALLGGPLCSFRTFKSSVEMSGQRHPIALWHVCRKCFLFLSLECLKALLGIRIGYDFFDITHHGGLQGVVSIWGLSLLYKMSYYSHWVLSEAINIAAGLGFGGCSANGSPLWNDLWDADIWTLETTNMVSQFARSWNKTTADWLRRLVFQKINRYRLLATFGFSAWWHGLHLGQIVGFLCWAATVEADYRIHAFLRPYVRGGAVRWLYQMITWAQTQLVVAFVIMTVELRKPSAVRLVWGSPISLFPLLYCLLLFVLPKKKQN
ncbi:ghrelin O-acyltransferase isoform X1 [Erpetoichthys calabaricus]|uniref:ghrelin O-acyltransferase isoform X1 n=2 Tax=Erpetoichthys calabaricus TaxID=27687 RepID=UPI0022349348|nr:ghrelin O-acyltransferase isoform X1 [Erpetoichthys calabaricus]